MHRRPPPLFVLALLLAPTRAFAAPAEEERPYGGVTEVVSLPTLADDASVADELAALRARVDELERRERERAQQPPPVKPETAVTPRAAFSRWPVGGGEVGFGPPVTPQDYGLRVGGYLQVQYQWNQLSEDELQQGGVPLNRDGFAVRRGRLRVSGDWKYVAFAFELDGSTTNGPFVGVRQAHLSAVWRNPDAKRPPYMMLTAGLTEVPFGYELRVNQRDWLFMERSSGSLAMFPGPVDIGVRLRGGVRAFRYDVAVMNGTPLNDVAGSNAHIDPTRRPDIMGRIGFDVKPRRFAVSGGASFLAGTGLHEGTDATKNQLQWIDLNENGTLETAEIFSVPGTAALPSIRFTRWAVNADLQFGVRTKIGWTRLLGELTVAQNLDRVADPIVAGADLRHLQAYGAVIQDLTRWAVLGLRYDLYDHNSDLLMSRKGRFVPVDATVHSISPMVGAILPEGVVKGIRGRLVLQYDVVLDAMGRDERGVPTDLKNDRLTVRAHLEF